MVTVEMLDSRYPHLRFSSAFATSGFANAASAVNLSLPNMEEAKTLRDALSAFIAFHEGCEAQTERRHAEPDNWGAP